MTSAPDRAWVLATCTAVTFLYSMSLTAVNVSLPQIQGALSATQDQIAWVITSNLVATAVMTPLTGWLAARFGARCLCLGCVAGFAARLGGLRPGRLASRRWWCGARCRAPPARRWCRCRRRSCWRAIRASAMAR